MANKYVSYGFDKYEWKRDELRLAWMITALGDWSDDDGVSFPSVARLALRCKVSTRQCTAMTGKLEDRGDILIIRPSRQGRGQYNHYLITDDKSESEIADVIRRHPRFKHLNPEATAADVIEKRRASGRKIKEEDMPDEKQKKERLTQENFTPEIEAAMLTTWGKLSVPPGFDAAMLSEIQTAIERSTWRLTEDEKKLACYLVHATNWPLPTDKQGRKAWIAGFRQHKEMLSGASLETIGLLYAASFAQMREYQKRAKEESKPFTINPVPQTLTRTMRGKWAEMQERERVEKAKLLDRADAWAAFRPERN